ncbi:MAG: hypothetical protein AAF620_18130 [Bacteroidota bacterium]
MAALKTDKKETINKEQFMDIPFQADPLISVFGNQRKWFFELNLPVIPADIDPLVKTWRSNVNSAIYESGRT